MIKSIRLVNWRSHADSRLEFRQGTNLLVGIMGAGKSSILEAISFSLFGTFPALERRKLKLDNVVRLNEPAARVILEFDWEGVHYRAERAVERSKKGISSHAELYRGEALVEHGPTAVTSYIKSITGVDYDLFTRAIYSEQNNIDYFLTLGPGERKEQMDALLGLDRFELARTNIVAVINQLRSRRGAIEERFNREKLAWLEAREKQQSGEHAAMEASLASTIASCGKQAKQTAEALAKFEGMRRAKELADGLGKEEIRLSVRHEALKGELGGKAVDEAAYQGLQNRLESLVRERSALGVSLKPLEEKSGVLSKELGSLEAKLKAAADAKAKLTGADAELRSMLGGKSAGELAESQKKAEQTLLSLQSESKSLEHEISEVSGSLQRLRPGLSECPLCMSRLTDDGIAHVKAEKDMLVKQKKARSAELAVQLAQKRAENDGLLARLRRISLISDRTASFRQEAEAGESLHGKKAQLEGDLARLTEERKGLQGRSDGLAGEIEKAHAEANEHGRLLAKKKEAEAVAKALAEVKEKLSVVKFDEKSFEGLREAAEHSRLESERLLASKKSLEAQLRMADDMLRMVREELSDLRLMDGQIKEIAALEEQLSVYKNALLETQTGLRISLTDAINTAMNEIWSMFYPYRNYRALRLGVSEKDYVFEVDDGSGWRGLETVASGGERACAALALRVALAMVLTPKLSWLILDEPTHNLDAEAVETLSSALQFKVPEVVKQTFVITHDEAFMGSEFASSYRLSRDKERNGETKVEGL
jgi:exonuclease SbcC